MPSTTPVIVMSSGSGDGIRADVEALGDAEVGDLGVPVLLEEDVAGLDVTVQHAARVGGAQRGECLGHHEHDALRGERPPGHDLVAQGGPRQALHDEERRRVILAEVQHGHDVRVEEPGGDQRLLLEPLAHPRQGSRLGPQDLDRGRALEALVEGVEDPRHPSFTKEAIDAVSAADERRRARLHPGCVPRGAAPYAFARAARRSCRAAPRPGPRHTAVWPAQSANAAISPSRVRASAGDRSPKSR